MVKKEVKIGLDVTYVFTSGSTRGAKEQTIKNTIISGYLAGEHYQK